MASDPFDALLAFAPPGASLGMPTSFVEWCEWAGCPLTPGQAALARVAFDGHLPTADVELTLFGALESIPEGVRRTIAMRLGRGSGKSTVVAFYGVFRMVTGDTSRCGPGDYPAVGVVSTDQNESKQVVAKALALIKGCPSLAGMLRAETQTSFRLARPDGVIVRFETRVQHAKGKGARGPSWLLFVIDEAEFLDPSGDDAVARVEELAIGARPRLLPGGSIVLCSTPWPVESYVSKLFDENYGHPRHALCVLGPTLLLRDDPVIRHERDVMLAQDPARALREYDCVVTDVSGAFFEATTIDAAVYPNSPRPRYQRVSVGIDLAMVRDSAGFVAVERQAVGAKIMVVVTGLDLRRPQDQPKKRLVPSVTVNAFVTAARDAGADHVVADGHYFELVREHASNPNNAIQAVPAPTSAGDIAAADLYMRDLFREGLVWLPNDPRIVGQLKSVLAKPLPGGTIRAYLPRRAGAGHADLYSALRNAIWYDRRHGPLLHGDKGDMGAAHNMPVTFAGGWSTE